MLFFKEFPVTGVPEVRSPENPTGTIRCRLRERWWGFDMRLAPLLALLAVRASDSSFSDTQLSIDIERLRAVNARQKQEVEQLRWEMTNHEAAGLNRRNTQALVQCDIEKLVQGPSRVPDNYYVWDTPQFSDAEIESIINMANAQPLETSVVGNRMDNFKVDSSYRSSNISWLAHGADTEWIYKRISSLVLVANSECWQMDIAGFGENLQVAQYNSSTGGYFDWHMDTGESLSHRKISVTVQLSNENEYEGGELQLKTSRRNRAVSKAKGSVIMFPSYILHRVSPVTKGVRRSMVVWISGPPFR